MKRLLLAVFIATFMVSCLNDDEVIPVCDTPVQISSANITNTSIELTWTNNNEVKDVIVEYGPAGFQLGSGTKLNTAENTLAINNLQPNTNYDFYVTAICSADNISVVTETVSFATDVNPVVAQFLDNLSELNIFNGDLVDLNVSPKTFKYDLSTPLFTDYAHKLRTIALPPGTSLEFNGDGFPIFPTGTLISKTFYYNLDENDASAGRQIIETRVLIKEADEWTIGNYLWNEEQTEATLTEDQHDVKVDFRNAEGNLMAVDYEVPSRTNCIRCHSNAGDITPIGPKLRTMNFEVDGVNQLQKFIDDGHLSSAPAVSSIGSLPNWEDTSLPLESRARAYFDINCAHCHEPGGFCDNFSSLDLRYETSYEDSQIYPRRFSISTRMGTYSPGTSMPWIGTTMVHTEGYALIQEYLDSLD